MSESRFYRRPMRLLLIDIVDGVLAEGEVLPSEAELAEQFGVSRGVIRETVRGLEDRGMIVVRHGRRATVASSSRWNVVDADVLAVLVQSSVGRHVLAEFMEARRILEIEACGLAAERATDEDLEVLSDMVAQTESSARRAAMNPAAERVFYQADIGFHRAILTAAGNRVISRLTEPIEQALLTIRQPVVHPETRLKERLGQHRRIVAAIAGGDVEAARRAMSDHLDSVRDLWMDRAEMRFADEDDEG